MLVAVLLVALTLATEAWCFAPKPYSFTDPELLQYRREVRDLFYHGFDSYLQYGYPYDEVRPISCVPKKRKFHEPQDLITNDVLGNFTTTLVDSMTSLAVFGDTQEFLQAIELFRRTVPETFDLDSTVQVFETTIRMLGGMLSAHLYATDQATKVHLSEEQYDGFLLRRCVTLADKLLEAYLSPSGLPVPRINLRYGTSIDRELLNENNAAATASPLFEFRLLSMLTLNETYREVAEFAFNRTWSLRSDLNLLPMSFSPYDTTAFNEVSGIGASIDSFYETALKGSILFDDSWLYSVWETAIHALNAYSKTDWFYTNVGTWHGKTVSLWIDSLSAFFPGLLTLDGRIADASMKHLLYSKLWSTFGGIPERWNFETTASSKLDPKPVSAIDLEWYPLRPEFIESTYYLYRATKDVYYLNVGVRILRDIQTRFKAECGFAGLQDVMTGKSQDRMESFVLGETLKYLYLLFDEGNELHTTLWQHVFSTEAHPFWINDNLRHNYRKQQQSRRSSKQISSKYSFHLMKASHMLQSSKQQKRKIPHSAPRHDAQCPQPDYKSNFRANAHNKSAPKAWMEGFQDSRMLSNPRLFDIDCRYNSTLQQPAWIQGYRSLELTPELYRNWCFKPLQCAPREPSVLEGIIGERDLDSKLLSVHQWPQNDCNTKYCETYLIYRFLSITGLRIGFHETWHDVKVQPQPSTENADSYPDFQDALHNKICKPSTQGKLRSYKACFIDGIKLAADDCIVVNRQALIPPKSSRLKYLSINRKSQLLINCIPVTNIYVI